MFLKSWTFIKSAYAWFNDRQSISVTVRRRIWYEFQIEWFHEQLPLPVPCYDLFLVTVFTLDHVNMGFGYLRLPWIDGRWVQDPRTYSTRRCWYAFTSKSGFMGANCSPQSELGPCLVGLAPSCDLAAHCHGHCSTCVALGVRAMLIWRHPHLPPRYPGQSFQSARHDPVATESRGCARCGT